MNIHQLKPLKKIRGSLANQVYVLQKSVCGFEQKFDGLLLQISTRGISAPFFLRWRAEEERTGTSRVRPCRLLWPVKDEVFEEEDFAESGGDSARSCHPDYVRGRRILGRGY